MKLRTTLVTLGVFVGLAVAERPSTAYDGAGGTPLVPAAVSAPASAPDDAAGSRCLAGLDLDRPRPERVAAAATPGPGGPTSILDPAIATYSPDFTVPATAAIALVPGLGAQPVALMLVDDLGSRSRRPDGWSHPLPVARPDDAVMRVALARELRPGETAPDEAVLPATRIGQMLMVGFDGDDVDDAGPRRLARHIRAGRLGGVLFFKRNVKSAAAVQRLTALFRDAAKEAPEGLPVFLAVDQEGGLVQRLNSDVGFAETPSAAALAAQGADAAATAYAEMAENLAAWGFNLNLGPVVDLGFNDTNPVVTKLGRAYAPDPATVTRFAETFIRAHTAAGVVTALKHFPGHGSSTGDTHDGFVDVTDTFRAEEIVPYERLIDTGDAQMVMVGHVENGDLDTTLRPATLSPVVIGDVLRTRCGFKGVVISDDMEMGAIQALAPPQMLAREAILAGNDILVYGSGATTDGDLIAVLHARIRIAANDPAVAARIAESHDRVAALKATLPQ